MFPEKPPSFLLSTKPEKDTRRTQQLVDKMLSQRTAGALSRSRSLFCVLAATPISAWEKGEWGSRKRLSVLCASGETHRGTVSLQCKPLNLALPFKIFRIYNGDDHTLLLQLY